MRGICQNENGQRCGIELQGGLECAAQVRRWLGIGEFVAEANQRDVRGVSNRRISAYVTYDTKIVKAKILLTEFRKFSMVESLSTQL
jgi:hypothetical protein